MKYEQSSSISISAPTQKVREVFATAGFSEVTINNVESDPANNYYVCRKD